MNYNSMKATKAGKRSYDRVSISRSSASKAKRAVKKFKANWFVVLFVFMVSVVAGYFAHSYAFKNDIYEMVSANGEVDIILGGNEPGAQTSYTELGVKCIAFGKDYSKDCTVKYFYRSDLSQDEIEVDEIDISTEGIYYAVYECPAQKYKSVKLIRNIIVLGGEDNG